MKNAARLFVVVAILLGTGYAFADDAVTKDAVTKDAVTKDAVTKDPVDDADKVINDGVAGIDEKPGEAVSAIIAAFKEGRWGTAIGLLLMFLVWVTRRFVWKIIPKNILPWLTLSLAMVITVSIEMLAGIVWWKTLIDGFLTGGAAMAFWSLLFKHILPSTDA